MGESGDEWSHGARFSRARRVRRASAARPGAPRRASARRRRATRVRYAEREPRNFWPKPPHWLGNRRSSGSRRRSSLTRASFGLVGDNTCKVTKLSCETYFVVRTYWRRPAAALREGQPGSRQEYSPPAHPHPSCQPAARRPARPSARASVPAGAAPGAPSAGLARPTARHGCAGALPLTPPGTTGA